MNSLISKLVLLAFFIALFTSCAQVGSVTGGDKDSIPPFLVRSYPVEYTTNYKKNKIFLTFNEYFLTTGIEESFVISPPMKMDPKFRIKNRTLIIKFKEPLKDSITYTLHFGSSIKDFNESNPIPYFKFAFSTGTNSDSLLVTGKVLDSKMLIPEDKIYVMFYNKYTDSLPYNEIPMYIAKTDTSGKFEMANIMPGRYKVFALKDIDKNLLYNLENEKIAYLDTLIIPEVKILKKSQFLKKGTILHNLLNGSIIDTLKLDSTFNISHNFYTPNNVLLYSFFESRKKQYLIGYKREFAQKCSFYFNMPTSDDVEIKPLDTNYVTNWATVEKDENADSLIYWLSDENLINKDTLQFLLNYTTLDSLNQPKNEIDTIQLTFVSKKKQQKTNTAKKSAKPEIVEVFNHYYKVKTDNLDNFDLNKKIKLDLALPEKMINTNLIQLFKLSDTLVYENYIQKILKSVRTDSNKVQLVFQRPLQRNLVVIPVDTIINTNWYMCTYSKNRDSVEITISDSSLIHTNQLPLVIKYTNLFLNKQIQTLKDSLLLKIADQKIIQITRPKEELVQFTFEKIPDSEPEINLLNIQTSGTWYKGTLIDNKLTILLTDTNLLKQDTLVFKIKTSDKKVPDYAKETTFNDTVSSIYIDNLQKITRYYRPISNKFLVEFAQPVTDPILFTGIKNNITTGMITYSIKDVTTIECTISDENLRKQNPLNILISYPHVNRNKQLIIITDSLKLPVLTTSEIEKLNKQPIKTTHEVPVKISIENDSLFPRIKYISFKPESETMYKILIEDSAFVSIYNTPNDRVERNFTTQKMDYYGSLSVKLVNLGKIAFLPEIAESSLPDAFIDTTKADTTITLPTLKKGKAIVQLTDDKGNVQAYKTITDDQTIIFDYLPPKTYNLVILYDENNNGKWDTGNYLSKIKPEKVIKNPNNQIIKSKWKTEVIWYFK